MYLRTNVLLSLGLLLATAAASPGRQCPDGGVLDRDGAYFGSILSANRCEVENATCSDVFFFSEQRADTAVCRNGRWSPLAESAPPSCPAFVFSDGRIWSAGAYRQNTCDSATAGLCEGAYFFALPGGGSGSSAAVCVDDRWQPLGAPDGPEAYRLRPVVAGSDLLVALQRGLTETYTAWSPFAFSPFGGFGGPSGGPSGPSGFEDGGGRGGDIPVSETNVQEEGVDEEDRIETDGDHLYILRNHQSLKEDVQGQWDDVRVRVIDIDPFLPGATPVAEIGIGLEGQRARGLYLRSAADQLLVTASRLQLGWWFWFSPLAWMEGRSSLTSIDVADPAEPTVRTILEMDGEILSSRRIDDTVYIANRFHPRIEGLRFFDPETPEGADQLARIADSDLEELLPAYRRIENGVADAPLPLVAGEDCYLPTEDAPKTTADIITLVAVDVETMTVSSSKCFVGATETLYVSLESAYVASTRYAYDLTLGADGLPTIDWRQPRVETDLHKFSLGSGQIRYEASATVDGHLGWNPIRKPFRMSERGRDLRVVTFTGELTADRSPIALTVLRDLGDDRLRTLSRLPNALRPEPIGKPGESLYATRFVGDRAYLVTFRQTDPLYVVDLSEPLDPKVAGELEIPGFSDYLHPVEGGYLVGVGKDAVPAEEGDEFRGAWFQGVKLSLFDVRDPTNPLEVDGVVLGKRGTSTPVLQDHRAFTYLPGSEEAGRLPRFALGVELHATRNGPDWGPQTYYEWTSSGLHLFEVDPEAGALLRRGAMIVHTPAQSPPQRRYPLWGEDRSVLAGDSVFYVYGDDVYSAPWSDPRDWEGPE